MDGFMSYQKPSHSDKKSMDPVRQGGHHSVEQEGPSRDGGKGHYFQESHSTRSLSNSTSSSTAAE
jgi:hypothetical protein